LGEKLPRPSFIRACSAFSPNVPSRPFSFSFESKSVRKGSVVTAKIRIGAVSYLNTRPLIHHLEELAPEAELVLDYPNRLADQLQKGQLEVALIPIIEYFRAGTYTLVPDICIASDGPVLSVTLFSRVPWNAIQTVALDEGSRTSAALVQILLRQRFGVRPEIRPLPMDEPAENNPADAVLLIGDRAMRACLPGFAHAFDLGQEWHDWTGLPFVYAAWAVRAGVKLGPILEALQEAKKQGCAAIGPIAAEEAPRLGLDPGYCRRYLANIIRFDLGTREQAGMQRFYMLACELGLAPRGVTIEFYGSKSISTIDNLQFPI
jgi:chorismate dehydratase